MRSDAIRAGRYYALRRRKYAKPTRVFILETWVNAVIVNEDGLFIRHRNCVRVRHSTYENGIWHDTQEETVLPHTIIGPWEAYEAERARIEHERRERLREANRVAERVDPAIDFIRQVTGAEIITRGADRYILEHEALQKLGAVLTKLAQESLADAI